MITVIAALVAIFGHDLLHKTFRGSVLGVAAAVDRTDLWRPVRRCHRNGYSHRRIQLRRLPGAVQRRRVLQHHLRALRFGLQPLPAAGYEAVVDHLVGIHRRLRVAGVVDPARRVDGHVSGRQRRVGGHQRTGNDAVSYLGSVLAIVSTLVLVATMGLNAYSGMLTVVTGIDSLKSVNPTRAAAGDDDYRACGGWLVMSLLLTNATSALNTTLLIMLYLLAPWTAVNLTDYFFVRRGHYAIADLFTPNGIYGAWSWRGLTAFTAGVLAEIPFVDLPFFVGPAAKAMGEVDIAFIIGLLVSGVVYIALTRSLDVSAELALIESHPELADPASVEDIVETVAEEEK